MIVTKHSTIAPAVSAFDQFTDHSVTGITKVKDFSNVAIGASMMN